MKKLIIEIKAKSEERARELLLIYDFDFKDCKYGEIITNQDEVLFWTFEDEEE